MTEEKREIFTEKVAAGSRTYFFDVKESRDGTKYLVVSESRQIHAKRRHNRVMIFQEHLQAFGESFRRAVEFLGRKIKKYSLDEIRRKYPRAYERWTSDEDQRLRQKFNEGSPIADLAKIFQRRKSAIRSRLGKLGALPDKDRPARVR